MGWCRGCDSGVVGLAWVYDMVVIVYDINMTLVTESLAIFYGVPSPRPSVCTADELQTELSCKSNTDGYTTWDSSCKIMRSGIG